MPRTDAVSTVTGELFEKGWSRLRGSMQGLGRQNQMARAGMGYSPAIFKAIKSGGCHTRAQLLNQLEYLTTKSSFIVDSRSTYDGLRQLDAEQIEDVSERFAGMWNEKFAPKMGHTTHLLMAYPIGTRGEDVRDMAAEICERFFAQEGRRFDYLIAVHEDRAHPHAHIVLNRKSRDGETFYLGPDHHFNYDDFRLAMVEAAEKRGIRLEATRRVERGVTAYKAPLEEIYRAKEEGRAPVERQRVGKDLDAALGQIARHRETYRFLSGEASRDNREDVAGALFRATEILARGGHLKADGVIYMQDGQSFEGLVSEFRSKAEQAEQVVGRAAPERRAAMEKELNAIYRGVAHLNPLGERSATLTQAASGTGIYSEANIVEEKAAAMREPRMRAEIDTALRGTGLSSSEVIARIEAGAGNAALERQWLADDLAKIAARGGLDLNSRTGLEAAVARLDDAHASLGARLEAAGVIRDKGWTEADREVQRAMRERAGAADAVADRLVEAGDVVRLEAGAVPAERRGAEIEAEARQVPDERPRAERAAGDAARPRTEETLAAMREDSVARAFGDEAAEREFRAEIERDLTAAEVARLRGGDADALQRIAEDRLDRLYLLKAYLYGDEATARGEVMEAVVDEIADAEVDAQRARHGTTRGEKGLTHG